MIDAEHPLSLTRQAQLLDLSRASLYYTPVGISDTDLALMRRIDELHLELPFAGSRMLRDLLNAEGVGGACPDYVAVDVFSGIARRGGESAASGTPGITVSAAAPHDRSAEPSVGGDVTYIPMEQASCTSWPSLTGSVARS